MKRVGGFGLRKVLTKLITMKTAAFVHEVLISKFILMIEHAINKKDKAAHSSF